MSYIYIYIYIYYIPNLPDSYITSLEFPIVEILSVVTLKSFLFNYLYRDIFQWYYMTETLIVWKYKT